MPSGAEIVYLTCMILTLRPQAEALPKDDLFEEYPGWAYRGLAFVMLFNLLLIFLGVLLFGTHIL